MSEKRVQQWEERSSPGHVLMQQVNVYRLKLVVPMIIGLASFALAQAAFFIGPYIGEKTGAVVGWVTGKVTNVFVPDAVQITPAPSAKQFFPVLSSNVQFSVDILPNLSADVAPAMQAQIEAMTAGRKMEDCNFSAKITETWFDGQDATPKCRYSKDGTRLWVWAYVKKNEFEHGPFAGLVIKRDGAVKFMNLEVNSLLQLPGYEAINPANIPRTLSADFPELLI